MTVKIEDRVNIQSSDDENSIVTEQKLCRVYIAGAVNTPRVCQIILNDEIYKQIDDCIEFDKNADITNFQEIVNNNLFLGDYDSVLMVSKKIINETGDISGVSESESIVNCVNINTATKDQLISLPGIGEVYAKRIIDGRPYNSKVDIKKVKGIGDKTYEKLEQLICL